MRTLAEKRTSLRKARGLTQADPAKAVKVSRQAASDSPFFEQNVTFYRLFTENAENLKLS